MSPQKEQHGWWLRHKEIECTALLSLSDLQNDLQDAWNTSLQNRVVFGWVRLAHELVLAVVLKHKPLAVLKYLIAAP